MRQTILSLAATSLLFLATNGLAAIQTESVNYKDGDTELTGHVYWDDAIKGKRPGVIVVHEWWGLNDYARRRAHMLAEEGYAAFAIDMYGKDKVTDHPDQASAWMKAITENTDAWRRRALLALDLLKQHPEVDAGRTAAIGYCFGGATVMQMAYSGADLAGVASFHGSLPIPPEGQSPAIKAHVLIAHGNADSFVPAERIAGFRSAMDNLNVDWEMIIYGGAKHSFTNPDADKRGMEGLAYSAGADRKSWDALQRFLREIFNAGKQQTGGLPFMIASATEPTDLQQQPGNPGEPGDPGEPDDPGEPGEPGQPGRP